MTIQIQIASYIFPALHKEVLDCPKVTSSKVAEMKKTSSIDYVLVSFIFWGLDVSDSIFPTMNH